MNLGETPNSTELSWFLYCMSFCANEHCFSSDTWHFPKLFSSQPFPQSFSGGYHFAEQTLESADLEDLDRITSNKVSSTSWVVKTLSKLAT